MGFKHDDNGFLVGELLDTNKELADHQGASLGVLREIRTDISAIAKALLRQMREARAGGGKADAGKPRQTAPDRARDSQGRFVSTAVTPAGRRSPEAAKALAGGRADGGNADSSRVVTPAAAVSQRVAAIAARQGDESFGIKGNPLAGLGRPAAPVSRPAAAPKAPAVHVTVTTERGKPGAAGKPAEPASATGTQPKAKTITTETGRRKAAAVMPQPRGENGRFGSGGRSAPGDGSDGQGRHGNGRIVAALDSLKGTIEASDQIDPTIGAFKEVTETLTPIGRGFGALLGRGKEDREERKKERWYKRILSAIKGKKTPTPVVNVAAGGDDEGGGFGLAGMAAMAGRLLPLLIPVLGTIAAVIGGVVVAVVAALGLGPALDWLKDKAKAIAKPVGEAIDKAKTDFNAGSQAVTDPVKFAPAVTGIDGRNINDPRRLDRANAVTNDGRAINDPRRLDLAAPEAPPELPPAQSVAESLGRAHGTVKNVLTQKLGFKDKNAPGQLDPVAMSRMTPKERSAYEQRQRSISAAENYKAGNIGDLSDAQTRALVASTVQTESSGGNLTAVNDLGFMGRYQAGSRWLADAGLIKGGGASISAAMKADGFDPKVPGVEAKWGKAGGMTRFLRDERNWNNGLSYDKYLGSADVQDKAFQTVSSQTYKRLVENPKVLDKSPGNIASLVKAAHLAGVGGAVNLAAGNAFGPADANGTTAAKYASQVRNDTFGFNQYFGAAPSTAATVSNAMPHSLVSQPAAAVTPSIPRIPPVVIPSTAPDRLPEPYAAKIPEQLNTQKPVPVSVSVKEPVGQDVRDRSIAHIVSGGIGGVGS